MDEREAREGLIEIMRAVARHDRSALRSLYDRTSAKLLGVTLRILGKRDEAEDVLQDVYITVWNKADRFDPARASPITWLASIARNRAIDRLRARTRGAAETALPEGDVIADDRPDALAGLERDEDARRLRSCLEGLEPRARGAIVDAFYQGRTYADLATRDGVPVGTMKTWIRRGLLALRACLSP